VHAVLNGYRSQCMLNSVYTVLGVCHTQCMLHLVYFVLGVCCTWCTLMIMAYRDTVQLLDFVFCDDGRVVDKKERWGMEMGMTWRI